MRPAVPLLLALLAPAGVRAQSDVAQVESALALFDRLGLPSVAGKRFVVLNTGQACVRHPRLSFRFVAGWLLTEEPGAVELLDLGLVRTRHERAVPGWGWQRFKVELKPGLPQPGQVKDLDLAALASTRLLGAAAPPESEALLAEVGRKYLPDAEGCLLLWWARQRGETELAARLLDWALRSTSLEGAVAVSLAGTLRTEALERAHAGASRLELLRLWTLLAGLPRGLTRTEARRMISAYTLQLGEELCRREPTPDELAALPPEQQAAVWIRRLRDLAARRLWNHGDANVLGAGRGVNPARELVELGWAAVPLVIEHLSDPTPTRSLREGELITVGECCAAVFEAISDQPLGGPDRERAARAWWAAAQAKGERGLLIEAVSAGDARGAQKAAQLIERWREDVVPALRAALGRARREDRVRFAWILAELEDDARDAARVLELLEAQAGSGQPLDARVAATWGLLRRGRREALVPMIAVWEQLSASADERYQGYLLGLLARAGRPEGVHALGKDLSRRPIELRVQVLMVLAGAGTLDHFGLEREILPLEPADEAEGQACARAVEEVLLAGLSDEAENRGESWAWPGKGVVHRRVCDYAGYLLAQRAPRRYAFDMSASQPERDRQRAAILDPWRLAPAREER